MPLPSPVSSAVISPPTTSRKSTPPHGHPEVECGVGTWDKLLYGNHRFVVEVPEAEDVADVVGSSQDGNGTGSAKAYRVVIPWRRQDQDPASVDVMVVSEQTGTRVRNVIVEEATRETGSIVFEAIDGRGSYFVYYLPYAMLGKAHYPQAQYLPHRPAAEPAWAAAVGRSVWVPEKRELPEAELSSAIVLRYEAASERDSYAPMNFTARTDELEQFHRRYAGEAYLVFPEDRLNPVSMHTELPAHWVINGPARTVHGTAQAGENYVVQLGLYAQEDLEGVAVKVSSPAGGHCINTSGVDRHGRPWQRTLTVPAGQVQALYVILPVPPSAAGTTLDAVARISAAGQAGPGRHGHA